MSAVVQATCPGCKHVLRIPAEWLGQAFKCKHCGMVIQARGKTLPPRPPPNPSPSRWTGAPPRSRRPNRRPGRSRNPVAAPPARPGRSSSADPFAFDEERLARARSRRRSRGGPLLALILTGAVLAVAAAPRSRLALPVPDADEAHRLRPERGYRPGEGDTRPEESRSRTTPQEVGT